MELTSQAINEAEFSMARRGYDPDQVDEFLEKLAVAVDKQNEALAEARERASMADRRAAEAERRAAARPERVVDTGPAPAGTGPSPAEVSAAAEAELETLKRTLVLAQKTADATIRDAEDEARRMVAAAEAEARAAQEGTRARLLEEIGSLEAGRESLRGDVDALQHHIEEQRVRLRAAIADLQRLLDDPDRLEEVDAPALSGPVPAAAHAAPDATAALPPEVAAAPAIEPSATEPAAVEPAPAPGASDVAADVAADAGDEEDDAWARFGTGSGRDFDDLDSGPPTQPVIRLDQLERDLADGEGPGEDAYLSELRKAMLDDTGAPSLSDGFGEESGSRPRFGRRR